MSRGSSAGKRQDLSRGHSGYGPRELGGFIGFLSIENRKNGGFVIGFAIEKNNLNQGKLVLLRPLPH